MYKFIKKWWWLLLLIFALLIIFWRRKTLNAKMGGIIAGPSHENGGVKAEVVGTGQKFELQGREAIVNATTLQRKEKYLCVGTPEGITGALNGIDGNRFGSDGKCNLITP